MSYADIWKKVQEEQAREKTRRPNQQKENRLQDTCVYWFSLQYPQLALLLFAVPNGGKRTQRTIVRAGRVITYSPEAKQMQKEGVTAGVADLILLTARKGYGSLCIEMKIQERYSRQSESQKTWQKAAEEGGNKYVVCRTLEEFIKEVKAYLD